MAIIVVMDLSAQPELSLPETNEAQEEIPYSKE